jgi:hypothetical protein
MKNRSVHVLVVLLSILIFTIVSRSQSSRTLYFSNQFRPDAASMPQTAVFAVDDPIYLVLNLSRSGTNTIGDLASVDPDSGKKNFWLCFSPESGDQNFKGVLPKCVGILPAPLSDGVLNAKAVSYKILPGGGELTGGKTDLSEGVLNLIQAKRTSETVEVPFTYYIYGKADRPLKAGAVVISCRNWDSSKTGKYLADRDAKAETEAVSGRKGSMTTWVKGLVSKRRDPALEKAIKNSDPSPILHIVFLTPGYDIIRNDLGIVLRKAIKTVYVYKWPKTGKCFAHWQYYGYESLGGANFNTDLGSWRVFTDDGYHVAELNVPGTYGFPSGDNWEVDCAAFGG